MPIWYDSSEGRAGTRLPQAVIDLGNSSDLLEDLTGADLLVTPFKTTATTEATIRTHVEDGALLVQRKTGFDLIASLGERMDTSLIKMSEVAPRTAQRILLFVGSLGMNRAGKATINGKPSDATYWQVSGAFSRWCDRGGSVHYVINDDLVLPWLQQAEKRLIEYQDNKQRLVIPETVLPHDRPDPNDPLQVLVPVRDWRKFIVQLRGVGPVMVENLRAAMESANINQTLWQAILLLTTEDPAVRALMPKVDGLTENKIKSLREQFGLQPGEEIRLSYWQYEQSPGIDRIL